MLETSYLAATERIVSAMPGFGRILDLTAFAFICALPLTWITIGYFCLIFSREERRREPQLYRDLLAEFGVQAGILWIVQRRRRIFPTMLCAAGLAIVWLVVLRPVAALLM